MEVFVFSVRRQSKHQQVKDTDEKLNVFNKRKFLTKVSILLKKLFLAEKTF